MIKKNSDASGRTEKEIQSCSGIVMVMGIIIAINILLYIGIS
ncbi:MAG: hypothetical protein PHQ17_00470 [Methanobacterium sp.]|nr:hypothetical protein [Methanobacterium sp.]